MAKLKSKDQSGYHAEKLEDARQEGFDVVVAKGRDIQIDLDSQQDRYVLDALLALLKDRGFEIEEVKKTTSKSGNKHVYLRAPRKLSDLERVALQAILGSDRKREALGFIRIEEGIDPVSVFFEKKQEGF